MIAGANVRDDKLFATLDAIVVERPHSVEGAPQHLCLDKGYDNRVARELVGFALGGEAGARPIRRSA